VTTGAPETYAEAVAAYLAHDPAPWGDHPPACHHHPVPNLAVHVRRAGLLGRKRVPGGTCMGCGWRVEGSRWLDLQAWLLRVQRARFRVAAPRRS